MPRPTRSNEPEIEYLRQERDARADRIADRLSYLFIAALLCSTLLSQRASAGAEPMWSRATPAALGAN
jgi:hypothetical protein